MRRLMYLATGAMVAFLLVLVPNPANAAAVPSITTMGGPVNVLPSAVRSAAMAQGGASGTQFEIFAQYIYRASKSPAFWEELAKAQRTAAQTGKPLALTSQMAAEAKTVYPLATKAAPLIKGAGGVGAALTAYQLSSTLTNGALDMVGLDATGTVCNGVGQDLWGKVVATAAGANCAKIWDFDPDFKMNTDASGQWSSGKVCHTYSEDVTACVQLTGSASRLTGGTSDWTDTAGYRIPLRCFDANFGRGGFQFQLASGTVVSATNSDGDKWWNADFPDNAAGCTSAVGWPKKNGSPDEISGIRWGTQGSWEPAVKGSADPRRTLKCVIAGTDGKQYTAESDPFFESAGVIPDPKCANLPAGVQAEGTEIVETGGDNGDQKVWDAKSDPKVLDATTKYGECGTTSVCPLVLSKNGQSCFDAADCAGWTKDADQDQYKCTYGTYAVALSECKIYANRWSPDAQKSGNTLTDPDTGKPLKNPYPAKDPGSDAATGNAPVDAGETRDECWSTSWGVFNPLTWVYRPIQCAVQWAAVPRPSAVQAMKDDFEDTYAKTAPAQLGTAASAWNFHPIATGCSGLTVPWSQIFGHNAGDWHLLAACSGDPLVPTKNVAVAFLTLVFAAGGGFGAYRIVGSTIKIAKIGGF